MDIPQDIEIFTSNTNHLIDPVTVIYQDLLHDIFLYLKPLISEMDWIPNFQGLQQPILRLSHVSKAWRRLVQSFPLLWNCLEVPFSRYTQVSTIEILEQVLKRSGNSLLHISLHINTPGSMLSGCWGRVLNALLEHCHRWYMLKFIGQGELLLNLNEAVHRLPLLTSVSCMVLGHHSLEQPHLSFLNRAPNVRNLRLHECVIDETQSFPNLTRLECPGSPIQTTKILLKLAGCSNIEHLKLGTTPIPFIREAPMSFPRLSVLRLVREGESVLNSWSIKAPMLRCLIVATVRSRGIHLSQLFQFISICQLNFRLHTLGLSTSFVKENDLYQVLSITDSLVTFYFCHTNSNDVEFQQHTFPEILIPDQLLKVEQRGRKPKVILPNLENLYYRTDTQVPSPDLINMIKIRWNGYQSIQEYNGYGQVERRWKRIRTVHLSGPRPEGYAITDRLQAEIVGGLEVYHDLPLAREGNVNEMDGYDCIFACHRGV